MKLSQLSLIPCQEQWMHSIQECPHLVANKRRRRIKITINSLLKNVASFEPQIAITTQTPAKSWSKRLWSGRWSQGLHLSATMITNTRTGLCLQMMMADTKCLWTSINRKEISSARQKEFACWMNLSSQTSDLIRMRWEHQCLNLSRPPGLSSMASRGHLARLWVTMRARTFPLQGNSNLEVIRDVLTMKVVKKLAIEPRPVKKRETEYKKGGNTTTPPKAQARPLSLTRRLESTKVARIR